MALTPRNRSLQIEAQQRELCAELFHLAQALGWDELRFKRFVVASMQTISYERDDFLRCEVATLRRMRERLRLAAKAAAQRLPVADRATFWAAVRAQRFSQIEALAIESAWSSEGVTDWACALAELVQQQTNDAAQAA